MIKNLHYSILALLILSGVAAAHTVTFNFAARIDANNTVHVNDTDYNTSSNVNSVFALSKNYMSINSTTVSALVSAGSLLSALLNTTYFTRDNSSVVLMLHMDNSTLDSSIYGSNGTGQGVSCLSTGGKILGACSFDGGYINGSFASYGNGITVMAWINQKNVSQERVIGVFEAAGSSQPQYALLTSTDVSSNFVARAQIKNRTTYIADKLTTRTVQNNSWTHIAMTFNGTILAIYINAQQEPFDAVGTIETNTTPQFYVGTRGDLTGGEFFNGSIDEVKIYNRSLASDEIYREYVGSPHYVLMQMTQSSDNNRFLIAAANGTYNDIENKLNTIAAIKIVSSAFGHFAAAAPAAFITFIRLEYANIDLDYRAEWSGAGQLRITNRGNTARNIPNVTIEVVK